MADEAVELFWEELDSGEVHIRDKWQFTLKSEFFPQQDAASNVYSQEFYLFIPSSLQVDATTYSKNDFYLDETNLIRYKTPEFSFAQLLDPSDNRSPLIRILSLCNKRDTPNNRKHLSDELKLLANVVRSLLRREMKLLVFSLKAGQTAEGDHSSFCSYTQQLCAHIYHLRSVYKEAKEAYLKNWKDPLFYRQMLYIDEFVSDSISYYVAGLLENIRLTGREEYKEIDKVLSDLLLEEKKIGDAFVRRESMQSSPENASEDEGILYRFGLLNKFVLDALLLRTNRFSSEDHYQRYQHWFASLAAAAAMFVYFSLFVWLGNVFVINSQPFIILMIIVYVLKDRMKEWLRAYSYRQASRWFPDYTTIIKSANGKYDLGVIKEFFSFIKPFQLPQEIREMRNREFHSILEEYQRTESVIFYKRIVEVNARASKNARRYGLNVILRFNIHRFLYKAADPSETHLVIDPETRKLISMRLPKVYHINLIIVSTPMKVGDIPPPVEFKKLRLIIDKNGIKRIEQLKSKIG